MLASKYADPQLTTRKESPPSPVSPLEDKPLPAVPQVNDVKDEASPVSPLIDVSENVIPSAQDAPAFKPASVSPTNDKEPVAQSAAQDLQDLASPKVEDKVESKSPSGEEQQVSGGSQEPISIPALPIEDMSPSKKSVDVPNTPVRQNTEGSGKDLVNEVSAIDALRQGVSPTKDTVKRVGSPANMGIKKRLSKTGKPCIIRIPMGSVHKQRNITPMTADDVKARLETFIQQGFNVNGFDQSQSYEIPSDDELHTENKRLFDEPPKSTGNPQKFEVCIPDQRKWDAYVNQMTEEKLKALGVTTTADEPAPAPSSRTDSPFGSLATSPPPPTSSAASQQLWRNSMPFAGPFPNNGPTPNSQQARPGHLSRQSTANYSFSPSFGFDPLRNQMTSPQFNANPQALGRGQSPILPVTMQRQPSALSRASPDVHSDGQRAVRNFTEEPRQPSVASGTAPRKPTLLSGQSSTTNTNPHSEQEDDSGRDQFIEQKGPPVHGFNGNIAYPKPQGHRHNISENLEREAESAQYYPGEFVEEKSPSHRSSVQEKKSPFSVPQPSAPPVNARQVNGHQSRPSMASNTSSHLNVEAAEFKFGGNASQNSKFTVPKNAFVPGFTASNDPTKPHVSLLTAHANGQATGGTDFNAATPIFRPAPVGNFGFTSAFDFTAKGPSMNDNAKNKKTSVDISEERKEESQRPGLFSRILSDVIKPSKKSKAIPIIDPSTLPKKESEEEAEEEDESGRPMQNQNRVKRGRLQTSDADDVPKFAIPSSKPYVPPQKRAEMLATPQEVAKVAPEIKTQEDDGEEPWHDMDFTSQPTQSLLREPSKTPPVPAKSPARASSAIRDVQEPRPDSIKSPTYQEIDAIMEHLNQSDNDVDGSVDQAPGLTSDAANGAKTDTSRPVAHRLSSLRNNRNLSRVPTDWLQEQLDLRTSQSPVRKLNNMHDNPVSDWDDMISAGTNEDKFIPQAQFFDTRVKGLIEAVLKKQLSPLQQHVKDVGASVQKLSARDHSARRPVSAYEKTSSDADDEEESDADRDPQPRPVSHKSAVKFDQIKAAVASAMENVPSKGNESEVKARMEAEQRANDVQKLLDISEKEIAIYKESTEELESKIKSFDHERHKYTNRISDLERIERELKGKSSDMSREVHALEETLNEYRTSSTKWRQEIDGVKQARETMNATIERLREEAKEGVQTRDALNDKIIKMQEAAAATSEKFSKERETWNEKDEQQAKEIAVLGSKMSEELRLRTKTEEEVDRLSAAERVAIRTNVTLEEMTKNNGHLTEDLARLRADNMNLQNAVAFHEREAREAKDIARAEMQRNKTLLEADVEVANKKIESVRADLETRLQLTREELDRSRDELEGTSAGHKRALEKANESRAAAIRQATDASNTAFAEERKRFEQSLRDLSNQHDKALKGLSQEHEKAKRELSQHHERVTRELSDRKDYERRDVAQQKDRQIRDLTQQKDREIREARQAAEQGTRTHKEVAEHKDKQMREVIEEADRTKNEASQEAERRVKDILEKARNDRSDRTEKHKQALRESAERHEQAMQEANESHEKAKKELTEKHEQAMQETLAKHEQHKYEMTERREEVMTELTQQHQRSLQNAQEDKKRVEKHHNELHKVSDEKIAQLEERNGHLKERETHLQERNEHLEDRIKHLEDKVTVAQSAAQAAALAAQQSKTASHSKAASEDKSLTKTVSHPAPHDRVSPQALRESIVVLQEQLQERETRIESLESEVKSLDHDAPAKLNARETEIGWLRELLGVRIDDLSELVNTLSSDQYNRAACRDAAIRIRANLQMEQQVKERLISGGPGNGLNMNGVSAAGRPLPLPSLTDIQNFASPKAAQLAAAWGNWRKGGQSPSVSNLRDAIGRPSSSASHDHDGTPSKYAGGRSNSTTSAQTFLSGLMTPPASNLRRTPSGSSQKQDPNANEGNTSTEQDQDSYDDDIDPDPDTRPLSLQLGDELDNESVAGSVVSAQSPIRSRPPISARQSDSWSPQKQIRDKTRTGSNSSTSRSRPKPQARPGIREQVAEGDGPVTPPLMRKGSYGMSAVSPRAHHQRTGSIQGGSAVVEEEDVVEATTQRTNLEPFGGVVGGEERAWGEEARGL